MPKNSEAIEKERERQTDRERERERERERDKERRRRRGGKGCAGNTQRKSAQGREKE